MGYYSSHSVAVYDKDLNLLEEGDLRLIKTIDNISVASGYPPGCGMPFEEECKWYDLEKDVKVSSLFNPDLYICIRRQGEENFDLSETVFFNGKIVGIWVAQEPIAPSIEELVYDHYHEGL